MATVTTQEVAYDVATAPALARCIDLFCDQNATDDAADLEFRVPALHGATWHTLKPGEHLPIIALPGATIDQLLVRGASDASTDYRAIPSSFGGR